MKRRLEESLAEARRLNSAYRVHLYESQSGLDLAVEWARRFQHFWSSLVDGGDSKERNETK